MLLKVILLLSLTAYIVSGDTIDENIEKAKKISKLSKDKNPNGHNDIDDDDLTEGDMKLTKKQKELYYGNRTKRNALKNENYRWTNNVIPYKINNAQFSSGDITKIKKAMKEWQDTTCIRFRQGCCLGETCLSIIRDEGCWSYIGMSFPANEDQTLSLGDGCLSHRTILHELGHAIGFLHEQSRADRDEYITIHLENVHPNMTDNFRKESLFRISYFGVSYDYFSVMHYGPWYFSANGKKTITTKGGKYDSTIGGVNQLSEKDIKMTRNMYKCGSWSKECKNGFVYNSALGKCYLTTDGVNSYKFVYDECHSKGGYLATFESNAEMQRARKFLKDLALYPTYVFVGGMKLIKHVYDGELNIYKNFDAIFPNIMPPEDHKSRCLTISRMYCGHPVKKSWDFTEDYKFGSCRGNNGGLCFQR